MENGVKETVDHKPVYCHRCRGQNTWERNKTGNIETVSGKVFMLGWRCSQCGKTSITTNPDFT